MMIWRRRRADNLDMMRFRLIRETEAFLELGLRHEHQQVIIPTIEVGAGTFPPGLAHAFWSQVLPTS